MTCVATNDWPDCEQGGVHFRARLSKRALYQQRPWEGVGGGVRGRGWRRGDGERYRDERRCVVREVTDQLCQSRHFSSEVVYLAGRLRDRGHGGRCCVEDLVSQGGEIVEALRSAGGGEYHPDIGREALEKQLAEGSEQLLHPAEELRGPTIAQLHGVEELL